MNRLAVARFYRALWLRREKHRYRKWRHYVATEPADGPNRVKWFNLYHEAHTARVARDKQIAKLAPSTHFTGVSEAGIALIKEFEGFPNGGRPYRDPIGVWTIGYGHIEGVHAGSPRITQAQADRLLRDDLNKKYAPAVVRSGKWTQNEGDALTSFVYNLGTGALGGPGFETMGRALKTKNRSAIGDAMLRYDHAGGGVLPGLTRRRKAERALFLKKST